MSEELESFGPSDRQPQPLEMKHYLELLAAHGVDFASEDFEHLAPMDNDELTEYFFQSLLEAGIEDPEGFMVEHNLVEGFRVLTAEEFEDRSGDKNLPVDPLDEKDRRQETENP